MLGGGVPAHTGQVHRAEGPPAAAVTSTPIVALLDRSFDTSLPSAAAGACARAATAAQQAAVSGIHSQVLNGFPAVCRLTLSQLRQRPQVQCQQVGDQGPQRAAFEAMRIAARVALEACAAWSNASGTLSADHHAVQSVKLEARCRRCCRCRCHCHGVKHEREVIEKGWVGGNCSPLTFQPSRQRHPRADEKASPP